LRGQIIFTPVDKRWHNRPCIVAASGPSLDADAVTACLQARLRGYAIAVVNDAYRKIYFAHVLYSSDRSWWRHYKGCRDCASERWTGGGINFDVAKEYGLSIVNGRDGDTFSLNPSMIHFGANSGFALINLALLFGANPIVLVGFNMKTVDDQRHFFGDHPKELDNSGNFAAWVPFFDNAAKRLPEDRVILNATPNSALNCFKRINLEDLKRDVG
jgi:hypothetical protein